MYFVTICTGQRRFFFSRVLLRQLAEACWLAIPSHHTGVTLDEWVLMPNHLHGLIRIHDKPGAALDEHRRGVQLNAPTVENDDLTDALTDANPSTDSGSGGAPTRYSTISPRRGTLSVIVRTYKAAVTTACRSKGYIAFEWQRNYYEHVVRNARELDAIRRYIRLNPVRWHLDRDNPANARRLGPPLTIGDYLVDLELP
jgi:REP element-mobilizing transposase RayT